MRNKIILLSLGLTFIIPILHSSKASPKSKPRIINRGAAPCQEGQVLERTYCPDRRTIRYVYVCKNGQRVRNESYACRPLQEPQEQPVQEEQRPIVLNRCGTPEGGWQNGRTYVLDRDIRWQRGDPDPCLTIGVYNENNEPITENITLDCNGHSIIGENRLGAEVGVVIGFHAKNIELKKCNISGFAAYGLRLANISSGTFSNNTFSNNRYGIAYETTAEKVYLIDNEACDNVHDVGCLTHGFNRATLRGSGNLFNQVDFCVGDGRDVYKSCEEN